MYIYLQQLAITYKGKRYIPSDVYQRLLAPLLENEPTNDYYSHLLSNVAKHFPQLIKETLDNFNSMTDADNKWNALGYILLEISRGDIKLVEKMVPMIIQHLKRIVEKASVTVLFALEPLQTKLVMCLDLLRRLLITSCLLLHPTKLERMQQQPPSTPTTPSTPFGGVEQRVTLLENMINTLLTLLENRIKDVRIFDLICQCLIELVQKGGDVLEKRQITMIHDYIEKQINKTVPMISENNWLLIDDYVGTCQGCGTNHGMITPKMFRGVVNKRNDASFEPEKKKRRLEK
jgi:hypothetical protein